MVVFNPKTFAQVVMERQILIIYEVRSAIIIFIYKLLIVLRIRRSQITDHARAIDGEETVSKK